MLCSKAQRILFGEIDCDVSPDILIIWHAVPLFSQDDTPWENSGRNWSGVSIS